MKDTGWRDVQRKARTKAGSVFTSALQDDYRLHFGKSARELAISMAEEAIMRRKKRDG